jgi:tetratricopeptide (TPR) repeat protein
VGRDRELDDLMAGLDAALEGHPGVYMLAGEPGIGKTHLAAELAARAQARGAVALWGSCWEGGGAPAYWPWTQALRNLVRDRDPDLLRDELGDGGPYVAEIVGRLRDRLPDLPEPPPEADPERWRFRLFDAMTQFIVRATESDPIVLVLDDLHWADHSTLLALEFVARAATDARLLVIGTYRDVEVRRNEEVAMRLGGVVRDDRRLPLAGLDADDLAGLVEARTSVRPSPELLEKLLHLTEGNPFFATEVARLLEAEGLLDSPPSESSTSLPLPDGVRDAIRRRLEPLSEDAVDALRVASVIGRQFRLPTLAIATGRPQEELMATIDSAAELGVVAGMAEQPGRYSFSHALVRETLFDALSPSRRISLHGQVGEALERVYGGHADKHLSELAFHFLEAAPAGDIDRAVDYATRAGNQAMDVHAYSLAADLYRRAIVALDLGGPEDALRAPLLQSLGEALLRAGDEVEARATFEQAAESARRLGDHPRFARVALACAPWGLSNGTVDGPLVALLEEAIGYLNTPGHAGDAEAVGLLSQCKSQLAVALYWSDTAPRRRELTSEALELARSLPALGAGPELAEPTLVFVLDKKLLGTWTPRSAIEDVALSDELVERADSVGWVEIEMQHRLWRMNMMLERDDFVGFDQETARIGRMATDLRQPRAQIYVPLLNGIRAILEGRFGDAERLAGECAQLAIHARDTSAPNLVAAQYFAMRWAQGRLGELELGVREVANTVPAQPAWRAALSFLLCEIGRTAEAHGEVDRLAPDDFAALPRDLLFIVGLALLCETVSFLGDEARARVLHRLLEPYAERNAVSPLAACVGPVSRFLGLAAATYGDWDEATRRFDQAQLFAERLNARPLLAHLRLDEARVLAATDPPANPGRLARLVAEGRAIAQELAMDAIVARFDAIGAPPPTPVAAPAAAALSREGDVWTFGLEGRTVRVTDAKGVHYLASLLLNPGVEIHAIDLVAMDEGGPVSAAGGSGAARAADAGLEIRAAGDDDTGPVLDAEAKRAYKLRLDELRDELEEAESFNDPERASRAREEIEFLGHELARAVGLRGRDRKTGSNAERARVNVTRALRSVLKRVAEHDATLGRELEATIRTGTFCAFEPDPRRPVSWTVGAG